VRGRPGPRLALPSYFRAISFRCQASRVPGVAICDSARRPSPLARGREPATLVVRETKSATAELLAQHPILLAQLVDCPLLLLIHPARDGNQHEPKRVENAQCSTVSWALCIVFQDVRLFRQHGTVNNRSSTACGSRLSSGRLRLCASKNRTVWGRTRKSSFP